MVHIPKSCSQSWELLPGNDTKRYCSLCKRIVHNITGLDQKAITKLRRKEGVRLCGMIIIDRVSRH